MRRGRLRRGDAARGFRSVQARQKTRRLCAGDGAAPVGGGRLQTAAGAGRRPVECAKGGGRFSQRRGTEEGSAAPGRRFTSCEQGRGGRRQAPQRGQVSPRGAEAGESGAGSGAIQAGRVPEGRPQGEARKGRFKAAGPPRRADGCVQGARLGFGAPCKVGSVASKERQSASRRRHRRVEICHGRRRRHPTFSARGGHGGLRGTSAAAAAPGRNVRLDGETVLRTRVRARRSFK
mmetsp:Transcript_28372/g.95526  ORF Transcript_28372/g.95526 Transcript_28372/m.95526 type:complete len:234 (+) Transcript_28372:765-1466(+)